MSHDEAIDRAIDALMAGQEVNVNDPSLPEDAPALLDAASRLARGRSAFVGQPRPGFMLDLEQQLRADLRTGLARRVQGARRRALVMRWIVAGLLLAGTLFSALLASRGATVGQPLYPLKRLTEAVRMELADGAAEQANELCDLAWSRLEELRTLLGRPRRDTREVARTLEGIVDAYGRALALAGSIEDDPRVLWNARSGTAFAAEELAGLAKRESLSPAEREAVELAHQALRLRLLDSRVIDRPPSRPDVGPTATPGISAAVGGDVVRERPGLPGRPGEAPQRPPVTAPEATPSPAITVVPGQAAPSATTTSAAPAPATLTPPPPASATASPAAPTPTNTQAPPVARPPRQRTSVPPTATPVDTVLPPSVVTTPTPKSLPTQSGEPTVAAPSATPKPTEILWPTEPPPPAEPSPPTAGSPPPPVEPTELPPPGAIPTEPPPGLGAGGRPGSPARP